MRPRSSLSSSSHVLQQLLGRIRRQVHIIRQRRQETANRSDRNASRIFLRQLQKQNLVLTFERNNSRPEALQNPIPEFLARREPQLLQSGEDEGFLLVDEVAEGRANEGGDVRVDLRHDEEVGVEEFREPLGRQVLGDAAVVPALAGQVRVHDACRRVLLQQLHGGEEARVRAARGDGGPDEHVRRGDVVEDERLGLLAALAGDGGDGDVEDAPRPVVRLGEGDVAAVGAHAVHENLHVHEGAGFDQTPDSRGDGRERIVVGVERVERHLRLETPRGGVGEEELALLVGARAEDGRDDGARGGARDDFREQLRAPEGADDACVIHAEGGAAGEHEGRAAIGLSGVLEKKKFFFWRHGVSC